MSEIHIISESELRNLVNLDMEKELGVKVIKAAYDLAIKKGVGTLLN